MAYINEKTRHADAAKGDAMPGGKFPITNRHQLESAIRLAGRVKGGPAKAAAVRRYIQKRAKALGAADAIPKTWKPDGTLWTTSSDHAYDKSHGIKEGSPRDRKLDASRGVKD